ncbi:MAG: MTH1187 family thiamine-binding protein [Thermodesulfovibrionales bacterium]
MLVEFSIVPVGTGESLSDKIANIVRTVESSGLPYRLNPMGTVIEGNWEEVMSIIRKCHDQVLDESPRVVTTIKIDDRPGRKEMITGKISSVERKLGKKVNK